jgi:hypothetical protein
LTPQRLELQPTFLCQGTTPCARTRRHRTATHRAVPRRALDTTPILYKVSRCALQRTRFGGGTQGTSILQLHGSSLGSKEANDPKILAQLRSYEESFTNPPKEEYAYYQMWRQIPDEYRDKLISTNKPKTREEIVKAIEQLDADKNRPQPTRLLPLPTSRFHLSLSPRGARDGYQSAPKPFKPSPPPIAPFSTTQPQALAF